MNRMKKKGSGFFRVFKITAKKGRGARDANRMRKSWKLLMGLTTVLLLASSASPTPLQAQSSSHLAERVRHNLLTLPYLSVFDHLAFRIEGGGKVVLIGQVTRPTLKSGAENVVKRLEEVTSVDNRIEVLPLSMMDRQIRLATYRAIYYDSAFTRYAIRAIPPIHIVVKNGNVTLVGNVASESDKNVANILANGVPGVFSVKNDLVVEQQEAAS